MINNNDGTFHCPDKKQFNDLHRHPFASEQPLAPVNLKPHILEVLQKKKNYFINHFQFCHSIVIFDTHTQA